MRRGFTLVEIMIVVAIIALLAAIAIPHLLRAKLTANESSAIESLRSLSAACESYKAAQNPPTYPPNLAALMEVDPPYISGFSPNGEKAGYRFTVVGAENMYQAVANPITRGTTGKRSFCIDHTGILRTQDTDYIATIAPCEGNVIE